MKRILFILVLLITFSSYAQEETPQVSEKKNEVYLNTFSIIAFKWFDVSYEHIINEDSTIGISLLANLDRDYAYFRHFAVTPYYRHFFSRGNASGFFMETFTMINSGEYDRWYDETDTDNYYFDLAFGVGIGGKFVTKRGFIGEIHTGIGRNLFDKTAPDIIGKGGISIGYRF